jgi:hypothetical protein
MPRTKTPDLSGFDRAPADASRRGVRVLTTQELGDAVRVARLQRFGRREDATSQLGVSPRMLGALERGNAGAKIEALLHLLTDLGLDVVLVPRDPHRSLREPGTAE